MTPPRPPGAPWLSRGWLLALGLLAALSLGGYLLAAHNAYRLGFPLDDAWIHQTYARNLAERGEWAFIPGQPSAGSTAPLWSALLAAGHRLGLGPYVWTFLLGWAALWGIAVTGAYAFLRLAPNRPGWAPWAPVLLARAGAGAAGASDGIGGLAGEGVAIPGEGIAISGEAIAIPGEAIGISGAGAAAEGGIASPRG